MSRFQPENNHCNDPEGAVTCGALIVASRQAAELLAAVDQALDAVAQAVERPVEGSSAALGRQPGDGVANAPPSTVPAAGAAGVPFVADHAAGATARPSPPGPPDRPLLQQPLEDRRLVPLAGRQHDGQRLAAALGPEMDLRAEAAPAATERLRFRVPPFAPAAC